MDVEFKACGIVVELTVADDVCCAERVNGKGDAASAAVVDNGSNERHRKRAPGAPIDSSLSETRVHASEGSCWVG